MKPLKLILRTISSKIKEKLLRGHDTSLQDKQVSLRKRMDKKTPIRRSVWLSIAELAIFLTLCAIHAGVVPSQPTETFWVRLVINLLAGYMALIAGIATTWYVVFTYYLMKSTIEFNKKMSDPYANVSWEVCNEAPLLKAEIYSGAKKRARDATEQQPQRTPTEVRWAVLIIGNSRPKPIGRVSFRIGITGGSEDVDVKSLEVSFESRKLRIEGEQSERIGIIDLMKYAENVVLEMSILDFSYQATDSNDSQTIYSGEPKSSFRGFGMVVPGNLSGLTEPAGGTR